MPPSTTFEGRTSEEAHAKARRALRVELDQLRVLRHGRERYGGVFGFFQKERWILEVEMPERPRGRRRRDAGAEADAPDTDAPNAATGMEQLLEETTDVVSVDFSRALADVLAAAEATVAAPASEVELPALPPLDDLTPLHPAPADPCVSPQVLARAKLIAAGLPDHLLPEPRVEDPELGLLASLRRLPAPPAVPAGPGDVLVLLGPLAAAASLAEQLAPAAGEPGGVVIASSRPGAAREQATGGAATVRTVALAGAAVFKRRSTGKPTVVVIDAEASDDYLRRLVNGLRADALWGVLPAGTGREEVNQLMARAAGRLDALALYEFAGAERPAGLIGAGWPVAYLDGWAATPLALAARLMEVVVGVARDGSR